MHIYIYIYNSVLSMDINKKKYEAILVKWK